ncbi:MAG: DUF4270 family protein [Flavobacteriaceae bacterium]
MSFLNRFKFSAWAGIFLVLVLFSCEKDLTTIGAGVLGGEPFSTGTETFDVFTANKKLKAVYSNKLPLYQLGTFNDPAYGKTTASINSQIQLASGNPVFGSYSQAVEDAADTDSFVSTIKENERVVSVHLHIPYLTSAATVRDSDSDGVDDVLEPGFEDDANNDSDGDTLTNAREKALGLDPLNVDTDGDGINDAEDTDTTANLFPKKYDLDSIYGANLSDDIPDAFTLKVERSNYYLRDLDPNTNFLEGQEYFSNQEFSPAFVSDVLFEGEVTISNEDILVYNTYDDPDTEDDERLALKNRYLPGIRVQLDSLFFQQNLLDKEGSAELLSQANFNDFIRGLNLSTLDDEIMMLLDLKQATITVSYEFDSVNTLGEAPTNPAEKDYVIYFLRSVSGVTTGNAINTFLNDSYPSEIADQMDTNQNSANLYLKGGAGSYAELKLFGEDETQATALIDQIKANNWIINEANLVFYVDRNKLPINSVEPPRLYVYNAETNAFLFNVNTEPTPLKDSPLYYYPQYDGILEKSGDLGLKYTVRITNHLNNIVLRDSTNATLAVTLTPDINYIGTANAILEVPADTEKNLPIASTLTPLGTILYGGEVDPSEQDKRLKLEIHYTKAN